MVTLKDVEELGFEFVSKKKDKVTKPVKDSEVPESVVKALIKGHDEELQDEEDEDEEDFGTKIEDWEDPYEDDKYEEWRDSKLWEDE